MNGQKEKEENYKNGKKHGKYFLWSENGQKLMEGTFKNGKGNGKAFVWYMNGQKKMEIKIKDGEIHGKLLMWHENGQKAAKEYYKNGEKSEKKSYWDKDGNKIEESDDNSVTDADNDIEKRLRIISRTFVTATGDDMYNDVDKFLQKTLSIKKLYEAIDTGPPEQKACKFDCMDTWNERLIYVNSEYSEGSKLHNEAVQLSIDLLQECVMDCMTTHR